MFIFDSADRALFPNSELNMHLPPPWVRRYTLLHILWERIHRTFFRKILWSIGMGQKTPTWVLQLKNIRATIENPPEIAIDPYSAEKSRLMAIFHLLACMRHQLSQHQILHDHTLKSIQQCHALLSNWYFSFPRDMLMLPSILAKIEAGLLVVIATPYDGQKARFPNDILLRVNTARALMNLELQLSIVGSCLC